jgi:hypothetical protein
MHTARHYLVRHMLVPALVLAGVGAQLASAAPSASASTKTGVITGRVNECGPGPVVAPPGPPTTNPGPVSVTLLRDNRTFAVQVIHPSHSLPWRGTFHFVVPPGTYEVVSSYRSLHRWVSVTPGRRSVVIFGSFVCPLSLL